jgi:hypothetical protein
MAFILLLNPVDAGLPVLIAASRSPRPGDGLSRPGLRLDPSPRLATWEKGSGRTWAGIGASGLAGALVGGGSGAPPPEEDLLARALACPTPRAGAARCEGSPAWRDLAPFRLVLAGAGEAWLVEGGGEVRSRLLAGPSCTLWSEGSPGVSCPPAASSPGREGLGTGERFARLQALLSGEGPAAGGGWPEAPAAEAAIILGLAPGPPVAGRFLYRPAAGGRMLDYSNLFRRLRS